MKTLFIILFILLSCLTLKANVSLPEIFKDGMILQRGKKIKFWGWADAGEKIAITIKGKKYYTKADSQGDWQVSAGSFDAGGPYKITIEGKNSIVLENVLFGDVWLCSGQSNMEYPVKKFSYAQKEANKADYEQIRMFKVPRNAAQTPLNHLEGGEWKKAIGDNILNFSAVGYFYGKYIHDKINVPVGLISSNWGGTEVEMWTSRPSLKKVPGFEKILKNYDQQYDSIELKISGYQRKIKDLLAPHVYQGPGLEKKWYKPGTSYDQWKEVKVPSDFSETGLKDHEGAVWYTRKFDLPVQFWDKLIDLRLGRIEDHDMVWVNGHNVGETTGKDQWRMYDVPAQYLKKENNRLVVRVFSAGDNGGITATPDNLNFYRKGNQFGFVLLGGMWKYKKGLQLESSLDIPDKSSFQIDINQHPSSLYNAMIAPLTDLRFKGVIWYQGESNASRAWEYRKLFPGMIKDWRNNFDQGDFPFLFVQLANFHHAQKKPGPSKWAELREAQTSALDLPKTEMAVTIDIGNANNIHPENKQDVGKRLGLAARKVAYGQDVVHSGPRFESIKWKGNKAVISFTHIDGGMEARGKYGCLKGFTIAGKDKKFHWAHARIKEGKVMVHAKAVKDPVAVRYAWADNPADANLYNKKGLPAAPFRTDDWKGITFGKHYKINN